MNETIRGNVDASIVGGVSAEAKKAKSRDTGTFPSPRLPARTVPVAGAWQRYTSGGRSGSGGKLPGASRLPVGRARGGPSHPRPRYLLLLSTVLVGTLFVRGAPAFDVDGESPAGQAGEAAPAAVEFFAAMQQGMLDVRVVAHDYSSSTIRVRNVTKKPLRVELPATFAAVPARRVQARQGLRMRGIRASLSDNLVRQQANSQGLGGSLGGPWWNRSMADKNRGQEVNQDTPRASQALTLAAGQFAQARIPCFCLEYGTPDPNSRIPYVVRPLDELNQHAGVAELLAEFGQQEMNQYAVQLAAWHMANGVPWKALAKFRFPRTGQRPGHRVTQAELLAARKLVMAVKQSSLSHIR